MQGSHAVYFLSRGFEEVSSALLQRDFDDKRTVQRLCSQFEDHIFLFADGQGPRIWVSRLQRLWTHRA